MRLVTQMMKRIKQMGFLRLFGPGRAGEEDDGRVLHLFRNRIELKKSFSTAQEEIQRLRDRVKQQEGATARVQELLQGLEARLAKPDSAYPALVHYQLRDLWSLGRTLLQQFITDLEAQQVERERKNFFAEFNRRQFDRRQSVEADCLQAERGAADARAKVSELERQLATLQRFWHYFRRRRVRQELHAANIQALLAEQGLGETRAARAALEAEQPAFTGLSIEARRAINLAAVAYGQALLERLTRTGLFEAACKASREREPSPGEFGERAQCERLMNDIQRARLLLEQRSEVLPEIRARTEALRRAARFRNSSDVVPDADSLAGGEAGVALRVLADDSWEIYRVLLR